MREEITQIRAAAGHCAELTKQLLAFGRRQVLAPSIVNLNRELRSFEPLLRRLLRENIQIELLLARPDLATFRADAGQLQRVVMNLASTLPGRDGPAAAASIETQTSSAYVCAV